jgi:hypothetical protein
MSSASLRQNVGAYFFPKGIASGHVNATVSEVAELPHTTSWVSAKIVDGVIVPFTGYSYTFSLCGDQESSIQKELNFFMKRSNKSVSQDGWQFSEETFPTFVTIDGVSRSVWESKPCFLICQDIDSRIINVTSEMLTESIEWAKQWSF